MELNKTEQKIIELLVAGKGTKEVAAELDMKTHSVFCALTIIFKKSGVKSRRELITKHKGAA